MLYPIEEDDLRMIDAARRERARAAIDYNNETMARAGELFARKKIDLDMPVVHALGSRFESNSFKKIGGTRNVARLVFEKTDISPYCQKLDAYDVIVCASRWNRELLRAQSAKPVELIHEGIDPVLFCPGPRMGDRFAGTFAIFSGGKIELRKGQDLVLLAFREFARRHDDAVLVTQWHSPWPEISAGFKGRLRSALGTDAAGALDIKKWADDNGIDADKIIDLGHVHNQLMPAILREVDCALQPSRAEGGTNFVAMEAMACGVPAILAANTGMLDIIEPDNCIALKRQSAIPPGAGNATEGWGESDIEEIIDALERLYASTQLRRHIGTAAASFMQERSWANHAEALKTLVLST